MPIPDGLANTPLVDLNQIITRWWLQWLNQAASQATSQVASPVIVPFSPSAIFDASVSDGFEIVLTADLTAPALLNAVPNQEISFFFIQDASGGHSVTYPAQIKNGEAPDKTPNAINLQSFKVRSTGLAYPMGPMTVS